MAYKDDSNKNVDIKALGDRIRNAIENHGKVKDMFCRALVRDDASDVDTNAQKFDKDRFKFAGVKKIERCQVKLRNE